MKFPHVIRQGSVSVTIYRTQKPSGYEYFQLAYSIGGKRTVKSFRELGKAEAEARLAIGKIASGKVSVADMNTRDRESYTEAARLLRPLNRAVHHVVFDYVEAVKLLPAGVTLAAVVAEYAKRHKQAQGSQAIAKVVTDFLTDAKARGLSVRYVQSVRSHLDRFAADNGTRLISSVTTKDLESWLTAKGMTGRTRNNVRTTLVTLFHFAQSQGYLSKAVETEADAIRRAKTGQSDAKLYTPAELRKLLENADPRILPVIAISAFAGVRSATVRRMTWENIKWSQNVVEVQSGHGKKGKRYLVPLLPALAAWLAPYKAKTGKIATGVRVEDRLRELFDAQGIDRKENGFRDTFISCRAAVIKDLPRVSMEANNSVEMVRSKYLEAVTESEGQAWFAVMPKRPANIVPISKRA